MTHNHRTLRKLCTTAMVALALMSTAACRKASDVAVPYSTGDQPFVDLALESYTGGRMSKEEALKDVYPVVVHFPHVTCVGLNMRPNWTGGSSTECFDNTNGKLHFRYLDDVKPECQNRVGNPVGPPSKADEKRWRDEEQTEALATNRHEC